MTCSRRPLVCANGLILQFIMLLGIVDTTWTSSHGVQCRQALQSNCSPPESCCVKFEECPVFFRLIRRPMKTVEEIRFLQRLTCAFEGNDPLVCCPWNEVSCSAQDEEGKPTNPEHGKPKGPSRPALSKPPEKLVTSSVPIRRPPQEEVDWTENLPLEPVEASEKKPHVHPNLQLIPRLENCGMAKVWTSDKIVGGNNATLGQYPWMARLGYRNLETDEIEFRCGGTVINNRYILTSAHCTKGTKELSADTIPVLIRLGEHNTETDLDCDPKVALECSTAEDYEIELIIPHQNYTKKEKFNDIELIRVKKEIQFTTFVQPICLPFNAIYQITDSFMKSYEKPFHPFVGSKPPSATVTGWGLSKATQLDGSTILQEAELPIVSLSDCIQNYTKTVPVTEKQICAGSVKGRDSCSGDSGGPLKKLLRVKVPKGPGVRFFQIGIVSYGPRFCGLDAHPGVYARVTSYLDWILDNIDS